MGQETIRIMCPSLTCRKVLAVPIDARGRTVRCRGCGTNIRIPKKDDVRQPATAAPAVAPAPEDSGAEGKD